MSNLGEQSAHIFRTKKPNLLNISDLKVVKSLTPGPNTQKTFFISVDYKGKEQPVVVQTDVVRLVSHGIPKQKKETVPGSKPSNSSENNKEIPIDSIKLPLDDSQQSCKDLRTLLAQLDDHFSSDSFKKELFGANAKNYVYSALIKHPQIKEDDNGEPIVNKDKDGNPYPQYDCCKMKFNLTNDTSKTVKTKLIRTEDSKDIPVIALTMDEVAKEIIYNSEVKVIFQFSRMWANTTQMANTKTKLYGVSLKVLAISYKKPVTNSVPITNLSFQSDDEDDKEDNDLEQVHSKISSDNKKDKKLKDKKDKKDKKKKEVVESDEDENKQLPVSSDEEENDFTSPDKKNDKKNDKKKVKKTVDNVDNDNDSNDDIDENDNNDSDDEVVEVVKPPSKTNKNNKDKNKKKK